MAIILINATAARYSGALTILEDFISYLKSIQNDINQYYLFTSVSNFTDTETIKVVYISTQHWLQRIKWDSSGLEKWCVANCITPGLLISFQNTCTKFSGKKLRDTPQLVYYHQALSLFPYPWKIFKRKEFIFFLYAHFYKYFVNRNNRNATYVVQLPCIKQKFLDKFKNISKDRVFVIRPNSPTIEVDSVSPKEFKTNRIRLFYPATSLPYKNHSVLLEALASYILDNKEAADRLELIFTVPNHANLVSSLVKKYKLEKYVSCIGPISYNEILSYYKSCDMLLFPSRLESFGLPLVEAETFGLPIVASDLPYAREVLNGYENSYFCSTSNKVEWVEMYDKIPTLTKIKLPKKANVNSWNEFIELANVLLIK